MMSFQRRKQRTRTLVWLADRQQGALLGGQLARRYGFPYRSSNANASNLVDAQAAYESQVSRWGALMGHANLLMHGAGWIEGGLVASFEKVVLNVEMLQTMAEFMQPVPVDDNVLGLDAVREVGPGGHYFGAQHTLERYETAVYQPLLSDWRNFESWEEAGNLSATQRANQLFKQVLVEFEAPTLDPAVADELTAFVEKRREEGGAPSL